MASKECVRPKIFLKPTLITASLCLTGLLIIALDTALERQSANSDLLYKQTLFLALAGKEDGALKKTEPEAVEAISDARYFRRLYEQNTDWEKFWNKEWLYRTLMNEADNSDERKAYQETILKMDKDAAEIFAVLDHSGWLELNQEGRNLIPLILTGKAAAPTVSIEGPLFPGRWFWLVGIIISQVLCFFFYLIYWDEKVYDDTPWYRLPWGVPAVTIVFASLQPGALIIIVPYAVIKVLATDFGVSVEKWKKRKKSAAKPKTGFDFDKTTAGDQALAERLRSRLEGGNND